MGFPDHLDVDQWIQSLAGVHVLQQKEVLVSYKGLSEQPLIFDQRELPLHLHEESNVRLRGLSDIYSQALTQSCLFTR